MNKMPENELVVLDIAGSFARVINHVGDSSLLGQLGFVKSGDQFERPISGMEDREALVKKLISLGALFVCGHDWSPAEVVGYLQEQQKGITSYRTIKWTNPSTYSISEVQS
jgi:hypothetical protein